MVLNANDEVIISSTIANSFDAVLSLVEQTWQKILTLQKMLLIL
jgi:hypothetical protein